MSVLGGRENRKKSEQLGAPAHIVSRWRDGSVGVSSGGGAGEGGCAGGAARDAGRFIDDAKVLL